MNKDGYNILKLDLANAENKKIQDELKKQYNLQCGTPWLIDPEDGNQICGFREKDVIEKWANGEEIPAPPRPKGPMPRPPFHDASKDEVKEWKKQYKKWAKENEHLPKIQTAEEILERPRPKTQPPAPPAPDASDTELDSWGQEYNKWKDENSHLPNLQPVDVILNNFKQRRDRNPNANANVPLPQEGSLLQRIEIKLDKIINHLNI